MKLASVSKGDIVRVDGSLAYVAEKPKAGRLTISWVRQSNSVRTVGARAVEAAWKRIKG